jgi:hypothetical protein
MGNSNGGSGIRIPPFFRIISLSPGISQGKGVKSRIILKLSKKQELMFDGSSPQDEE